MGVPGHVELGHDGHVAAGRVGDDAGVVRRRVPAALVGADRGRRCTLGELGSRREGDPPSLVVAQVQVEVVGLQRGGPVDPRAHRIDVEEVACDVEHDPAVGEPGAVGDPDGGDQPSGLITGDELQEGLHAVEQAGGVRSGDHHAVRRRIQRVRLGGSVRRDGEPDALIRPDGGARDRLELAAQQRRAGLVAGDAGARVEPEGGLVEGGGGRRVGHQRKAHVRQPNKLPPRRHPL